MYRSIFEIWILFFPQKQSRFSFKPPFSHRCRGEPCLPAAQTAAALFREGSPPGKRAQAHTLRPCNPRMPVPFPQSRLSFKKNPARCGFSFTPSERIRRAAGEIGAQACRCFIVAFFVLYIPICLFMYLLSILYFIYRVFSAVRQPNRLIFTKKSCLSSL